MTQFEQYRQDMDQKRERPEVVFNKGPRFFKDEDGRDMFAFKADVGSEFVSKATDEIKKKYPKEWAAYKGLRPRKE